MQAVVHSPQLIPLSLCVLCVGFICSLSPCHAAGTSRVNVHTRAIQPTAPRVVAVTIFFRFLHCNFHPFGDSGESKNVGRSRAGQGVVRKACSTSGRGTGASSKGSKTAAGTAILSLYFCSCGFRATAGCLNLAIAGHCVILGLCFCTASHSGTCLVFWVDVCISTKHPRLFRQTHGSEVHPYVGHTQPLKHSIVHAWRNPVLYIIFGTPCSLGHAYLPGMLVAETGCPCCHRLVPCFIHP